MFCVDNPYRFIVFHPQFWSCKKITGEFNRVSSFALQQYQRSRVKDENGINDDSTNRLSIPLFINPLSPKIFLPEINIKTYDIGRSSGRAV
jgi:hypothetical protein